MEKTKGLQMGMYLQLHRHYVNWLPVIFIMLPSEFLRTDSRFNHR